MHFYSSEKKEKGFTLIELLVSVALFTVVMTVSIGTFLAIIDANRKAQSMKSVTNNLNFALDSMLRTVRTGYQYRCMRVNTYVDNQSLPLPGSNPPPLDCPNGDEAIMLVDDLGRRVAYQYDTCTSPSGQTHGCIERKMAYRDSNTNQIISTPWVPLTAPEVDITGLAFYVTGATTRGDARQPTVTMMIRGRAGTLDETESAFNIQTTVTQRLLDE